MLNQKCLRGRFQKIKESMRKQKAILSIDFLLPFSLLQDKRISTMRDTNQKDFYNYKFWKVCLFVLCSRRFYLFCLINEKKSPNTGGKSFQATLLLLHSLCFPTLSFLVVFIIHTFAIFSFDNLRKKNKRSHSVFIF